MGTRSSPTSNANYTSAKLNMSTVGNDTIGAFGTSPASGYNLSLSHLFAVLFLFLYRLCVNTNNLYATIILHILNNVMIYLMDFGIKICRKMPKLLTIQKLDCCDRAFSH
jgi:membrane protease YdiL (CAAX protease family)